MHIKDNLINFLYDKEYFVSIYDNFIYIFNYKELLNLNSENIILQFEKFKINIKGNSLFIVKMNKSELLIKGILKSVSLVNE